MPLLITSVCDERDYTWSQARQNTCLTVSYAWIWDDHHLLVLRRQMVLAQRHPTSLRSSSQVQLLPSNPADSPTSQKQGRSLLFKLQVSQELHLCLSAMPR